MRKNGYKRMGITEEMHAALKIKAKETHQSIREYIESLITNEKAAKKET
ncbi:MAG: hypothetical protein ABSE15_06390 [Candidatus Bathyarchaeia archaeon]